MDYNYYATAYYQSVKHKSDKYPRLKAWEFIYVYINSFDDKLELVNQKHLEKTALHVGFYLANWGMFRGKGELLYQNLDFFKDFAIILFKKLPSKYPDFFKWKFIDFANDKKLIAAFNNIIDLLYKDLPIKISDTSISKTLLGTWGQCPAFDTYFINGIKLYLKEQNESAGYRKYVFSDYTEFCGESLANLARLYLENHWDSKDPGFFTTVENSLYSEQIYPPAKLVDMTFWQYWNED